MDMNSPSSTSREKLSTAGALWLNRIVRFVMRIPAKVAGPSGCARVDHSRHLNRLTPEARGDHPIDTRLHRGAIDVNIVVADLDHALQQRAHDLVTAGHVELKEALG